MTMNRTMQTPALGVKVYTSDGDELGAVKEVQGLHFKVDAPMQPDYWLQIATVSTTGPDGVILSFTKDLLNDYKTNSPDELHDGRMATAGYRPWSEVGADYRTEWEQRYGASGRRWEEDEPYQRYGYEMSNDPRYQTREWQDVEHDLGASYGDWTTKSGYTTADSTAWERGRERARESWERARRRN